MQQQVHICNNIIILCPIVLSLVPPTINYISANPAVEEGSDLLINCSATGNPSPSYQWLRLDRALPSKAKGANEGNLVIPAADWGDIGVYACLAFNRIGTAQSKPIYVTMKAQSASSISGGPGATGKAQLFIA